MQAEPILLELEAVKERLAAEASGDTQRFLDQMEAWVVEHPHAGPVVNSPEELQARLRTREKLYRERKTAPLILKDEPPRKKR
jgi:hypothetical protein